MNTSSETCISYSFGPDYIFMKKNKQKGAGLKIFDLNSDIKMSNNVEKNLDMIYKKFGSKFKIKYFDLEVKVILEKITLDTNNFTFYRLRFYEKYSFESLLPFKIDFYDLFTNKVNSNSYIAEIHNAIGISGSQMVKLVLAINSKLRVEKSVLYDGATVKCQDETSKKNEMDLTFIKLLEKGIGFYKRFGFQFDLTYQYNRLVVFNNKQQLEDKLDYLIGKIRKIKISHIIKIYREILDIISLIVKTQDYSGFDIILMETVSIKPISSNDFKFILEPKNKVFELFEECNNVIKLLLDSKEIYLYKYMINLFMNKNTCKDYISLVDYLCMNNVYKIKYKNKVIEKKFIIYFHYLYFIKNSFFLSYTYKYK